MTNAKLSDQFHASGSFIDVKSSQPHGIGSGTATSEILFLKRLLFLKAALDNDQSVSNFAVPYEEDKAFDLTPNEVKPNMQRDYNRAVMTAPIEGGRRQRLDPLQLDDDPECEKPLAITNGGFADELNDSPEHLNKAILPPPGHQQRQPPKTAAAKIRPHKQQKKHNSLNLHVAVGHGS